MGLEAEDLSIIENFFLDFVFLLPHLSSECISFLTGVNTHTFLP